MTKLFQIRSLKKSPKKNFIKKEKEKNYPYKKMFDPPPKTNLDLKKITLSTKNVFDPLQKSFLDRHYFFLSFPLFFLL